MSHTIAAEFIRTVTCDRCNKSEEIRVPSKTKNVVQDANEFQSEVSPGRTAVRLASARIGWSGNWHMDSPHPLAGGINWNGDLCQECAEKLIATVKAFLADGIKGVVQMAAEEEEEVEIPF